MENNNCFKVDENLRHKVGVKVFEHIANTCFDFGLEAVTFYAFSTENWKRPPAEIKTIMNLLARYLEVCGDDLVKREVRFRVLGDKDGLNDNLREKINSLEQRTAHFRKTLNVAINYGGRDEIVHACKKLVDEGREINKENLSLALYTEDCIDPDLVVRTAGEKRLSNFLLWQASYAELYFTDVYWPDFGEEELDKALLWFSKRQRRFGNV